MVLLSEGIPRITLIIVPMKFVLKLQIHMLLANLLQSPLIWRRHGSGTSIWVHHGHCALAVPAVKLEPASHCSYSSHNPGTGSSKELPNCSDNPVISRFPHPADLSHRLANLGNRQKSEWEPSILFRCPTYPGIPCSKKASTSRP